MSYAALTTENPSFLKRFSHARRFDVALELLAVTPNDEVLDYGTGDGYMLRKLLSAKPRCVVGFEPVASQYRQLADSIGELAGQHANRVTILNDVRSLADRRFHKICCLEVLEHLSEANQRVLLTSIKSLLMDDPGRAWVVVSVPIEVGLSGLLKNMVRFLLGQMHPQATFSNIVKSCCLGRKIDRGDDAYISSHIGFNYRNLEKLFGTLGFNIVKKRFSPFGMMGSRFNSQVFFVLSKSPSLATG